MAFIDKTDYEDSINENILDDITESDDTKLDVATSRAITQAKGYLNARYDIENIFNKIGDDRNPVILMYSIDIALYHLHSLLNPRKIPKYRETRFEKAVEWFEAVRDSMINPPDLPIVTTGQKDYVLSGGNERRDSQI